MNQSNRKYFLVIIIYSLILYGKTLNFSFVTDDWFNLIENPKYYSLSDFIRIFSSPQINFGGDVYYRPLDTLYFLITYFFFGSNPLFYHLINLLLSVLLGLLLFIFLRDYTRNEQLSSLTTILFLSHPLMAEPVGWISARNQIILGIFFVGGLLTFDKSFKDKSVFFYPLSVVFSVFPVLFHETGIIIILIYLAYFFLLINKKSLGSSKDRYIIRLAPFVLVFMIYLLLRYHLNLTITTNDEQPFINRILTGFVIFKTTLYNIFFPFELKIFYDNLTVKKSFDLEVVSSIFIFILFSVLTFYSFIKSKKLVFGIVFFYLTFLPFSGIVKLLKKSLISDRYLLLPLIGVIIFTTAFLNEYYLKKRVIINSLLAVFVIVFSVFTYQRLEVWRDDLNNAKETVREFPDNNIYINNLAIEYIKRGDIISAEREIKRTLNLADKKSELILSSMALINILKGDRKSAERLYHDFLKEDPDNPWINYNLGTFYLEDRNIEDAEHFLSISFKYMDRRHPHFFDLMNNLGILHVIKGDREKARYYFMEALKIKPYDIDALKNLNLLDK